MAMKLTVAALLALLPLALARCPCPAAPAASKVCGSDYKTYDSQCHLECAAVPGLSAAHPGPCSAMEGVLGALRNTSLVPRTAFSNVRGTPAQDYAKLQQCYASHGCTTTTCSQCSWTDSECASKCQINCLCDCYGVPGSSVDNVYPVARCFQQTDCLNKFNICKGFCVTDSCLIDCYFTYMRTMCDCNTRTAGGGTSTTWSPSGGTGTWGPSGGSSTWGPSGGSSTPRASGASAPSSGLGVSLALAALGSLLAHR